MDTGQRIVDLLQSCAWVKDPAVAIQILPSFGEDVPAFVALPGQRPDGLGSLPLVCVPAVAGPLARVLATAGLAAARDDAAQRVDQLSDDERMADPLVVVCAALLREAAVPGLRSHAAPALAVAWAAPRMLRGGVRNLPGVDPDDARGVAALGKLLAGLEPVARGEALQRIGWELSGRLGAAIGSVVRSGLPLPVGGLLRRLTASRLLLTFPRGTLDRTPALAEVSAVLGAGIDARLAGAAVQAAAAVITESASRVSKGKAEGLDLALAANIPPGGDAMRALLHPVAGPLILGSLGSFVGARALKRAGMDGATAKALLKPAAHRALAAAWGDLAGPLREWDLLSAIVDRVLPIQKKDGRWVTGEGTVRGAARWEMLVPGGQAERAAHVVAVRLTALRRSVAEGARMVRGLDGAGAIRRAWTDLVVEAGASVNVLVADHGLAAFPTPEAAVRFALRAGATLSGPREVQAGPADTRLTLPDGTRPAIGVAHGRVRGGTDGDQTVLAGVAVADAIALAGGGGLSGGSSDRSGLRRSALGAGGLRSEGIVVQSEISAQMLAHLRQSGAPLHLDGEATPVGGLGEDFPVTPVRGWWDAGKQGIVVFISLADAPGAPVELLPLSPGELATFHAVDKEQARLERETLAPSADEPGLGDDVDPFASEETAFFTRPVAAPSSLPAPAPAPGPRGEPAYEGLEPSVSFMGAEASGSGTVDIDSESARRVSGESAAEAILSGGAEFLDDEEDIDGPTEPDAAVERPADSDTSSPVDERVPTGGGGSRGPSAPMMFHEDLPTPNDAPPVTDDGDEDAFAPASEPASRVPPAANRASTPAGPSAPMLYAEEDDALMDAAMPVVSAPMVYGGDDDEDTLEANALVDDELPASSPRLEPFAPEPEVRDAPPVTFGFVPDPVATGGPEVEIEDDWGADDDEDDEGWEAAVRGTAADREPEVALLRAGVEADLELVGVAGFSLQAGASAQGSTRDPYFDEEEFTGFYDERGREAPPRLLDEAPGDPDAPVETANLTELEPTTSLLGFKADNSGAESSDATETADSLVSNQGQAMFEASAEVAFGLADTPGGGGVDSAMLAELMRTFSGYVVLEDDGEYTFGLRDGGLIRDAHSFDTDGDEAEAYRGFLEAKIGEGFIPEPDRVVALLPGVAVAELDEWRVERAYEEVSS